MDPGILQGAKPSPWDSPMPTSNRSVSHPCSARVSATSRTAVYGPVRTVVWEGRSREAPPYPDPWPIASLAAPQHHTCSWGNSRHGGDLAGCEPLQPAILRAPPPSCREHRAVLDAAFHIAEEKRMRSEHSPTQSRTLGQRTATGPTPVL